MFLINSKQNYIIGRREINMQPKISKEQITCIYIHMYIFHFFKCAAHTGSCLDFDVCTDMWIIRGSRKKYKDDKTNLCPSR